MTTSVLLFSGGLDSTIARWLLRGTFVKAVYIPLGSRYTRKEQQLLDLHPIRAITLPRVLDLGDLERPDGFIPQRNTLLCTLAQAAFDADEVLLCSVDGEYSRDKHREFFLRTSDLLSYTAGKAVVVRSPLIGMTKSEAVEKFMSMGGPLSWLQASVSCYDPDDRACGRCMSCFRRWVALANNGLSSLDSYTSSPWLWGLRAAFHNRSLPATVPAEEREQFERAQRDAARAYSRLLTFRA